MPLWETYLEDHQSRFLAELRDYLRIPSISALPEHAADVQRAAEWVAARMGAGGLEHVEILPTGGHPVVYADWLHAEGARTILIYGHFDVQPVDPLELWDHPPFEPHIEGDRIYARGASDNKGNSLIPILAVEALMRTAGALPVNVKLFYEGQEEIGSPQLPALVARERERLACDMVLNADYGQWSETQPAILVGLKGICGVQIDVRGARHDLHSGEYGGVVQNPIHALVRLLDSMRSPTGEILVEGFYDEVAPLTEAERAQIAAVPLDEEAYKEELGVPALFGEPGYTPLERAWARPTLEINGIWGGFQGQGSKTVIPSEAHAKITCRLVLNQDPARIVARLQAHVAAHCPPGVTASVATSEAGAWPYRIAADHPDNRAAREVLTALYGVEPYATRTGGTIPVCNLFRQHLGVSTISFGFGLSDELIHAPNEFFRLSSFRRGQRAYAMILERLAERG